MTGLALGCILIWSYPLGSSGEASRTIEQVVELRVCDTDGRRSLQAVRVMRWADGRSVAEVPELRLPWSAEAPVGAADETPNP